MSQQYTLSVQREIPYSVVVQATYVGNHGVHVPAGGYNMNSLNPQYFSLGRTALQASVPNPYAGRVPVRSAAPPSHGRSRFCPSLTTARSPSIIRTMAIYIPMRFSFPHNVRRATA